MRIAVLGGLNLDIIGQPDGNVRLRDSNPGKITFTCGGVAHNVALALKRMGHQAALFTSLGSDAASAMLEALCRDEALDVRACAPSEGHGCAYLCLHEESGEMLCAVNDMQAMESLTPELALEALKSFRPQALVLDANLREDTLVAAAKAWYERIPVFLDPVSSFKAARCLPALPYLTAIKPNRMEALYMTGEKSVEQAAESLVRKGVRYVFISLGPEGVYYADRFSRGISPAVPIGHSVAQTGAGDAMFAGMIDGVLHECSVADCAKQGCRAAHRKMTESKG